MYTKIIQKKTCKFCKKEFLGIPSRLFCSQECRAEFHLKKYVQKLEKAEND